MLIFFVQRLNSWGWELAPGVNEENVPRAPCGLLEIQNRSGTLDGIVQIPLQVQGSERNVSGVCVWTTIAVQPRVLPRGRL